MGLGNLINRSIWAKGVAIALFGFVGVVGGVYVGRLILGNRSVEASINPKLKPQPFHMNLRPGDLFPYEEYTSSSGVAGNFELLLHDRESIIFFADLDCETCHDLLRFWNGTLRQRLKEGVQVIVCLPKSGHAIPPEFGGLLKGNTLVFIDAGLWRSKYNLVMNPTVVGVDNSGFVNHIQYGFTDEIDYELSRRFLQAEQSQH